MRATYSTERDAPTRFSTAVYWLLMASVALAPIPLGSNRPWAWSLLGLVIGATTCAWAWSLMGSDRRPAVSLARVRVPAILFLATCTFAALQALWLPFSPTANMFWMAAKEAGLNVTWSAVSISPSATWTALLRLLTYGCIFWLALQTCRSPRCAELAVLLLSMMTAAYGAYGFAAYLSGDETVLWFKKWAYLGSLTGTFVNRNSFATFVGLGLLCSLALIARRMLHARSGSPGSVDFVGGLSTGLFVAIGAATLQVTALLLTQSRGGLLSTMCAVFMFFAGISVKSRHARRWKMVGFGLLLGILAVTVVVSGGGVADRLQQLVLSDAEQVDRINIYGSTLKAIGDRPLLGFGYGTFEDAFKAYRSDEIRPYYDKAHNTYLQAAMELGIPAAVALIGAVAALAFRAASGLRRRRSLFVYAWLGASASLLVGTHALIDFSAQIPAVAMLYATILGIGCAQSWSSRIDTSSGLRDRGRAANGDVGTRQDLFPAPE